MGILDFFKKWKRIFENYLTYRRSYFFLIILLVLIVYFLPYINEIYIQDHRSDSDNAARCLDDHLTPYYFESLEGNANIRNVHNWQDGEDESYLPWVGNGHIGLSILPDSSLYIKQIGSKTISLPIGWSPIVNLNSHGSRQEAVATHYPTGILRRYQCYASGLYLSHQIYAHRSREEVLIQEIKIANPTSVPLLLNFDIKKTLDKDLEETEYRVVRSKDANSDIALYNLISALIHDYRGGIGLAVVMKNISRTYLIEPHRTTSVFIPTTICTETLGLNKGEFYNTKTALVNRCMEIMKNITNISKSQLKQEHIDAWYKLWKTGIYISKSKAVGALNGDKINATIYYVLTHILVNRLGDLGKNSTLVKQSYAASTEGCYGGYHHTLQAVNLWSPLRNLVEINDTVSLWLLTLEKQGCHKLIKIGALGVEQAMVLSFGGFRFTGQHLEFKIDPKFLHRDYVFRRINYDENTYINVTVTLQDDNKAQLGVSLDKSDRPYFACDGGCNLDPVQLGNQMVYFPVKLTEPITSILYITPDKDHIELIKDTLHVHKVVEAPAYDHHVIALHRHGHHLGGLPTFFWALICFLIIVFHLFLCKLIANEYCGRPDKHRPRYGKI